MTEPTEDEFNCEKDFLRNLRRSIRETVSSTEKAIAESEKLIEEFEKKYGDQQ